MKFSYFQQFICWQCHTNVEMSHQVWQNVMLLKPLLTSVVCCRGDVKVIMATNRIESLDPALIRPGRIDRKIEFPLPDEKTKRRIFNIHTNKVSITTTGDSLCDFLNVGDFIKNQSKFVCFCVVLF